MRLGDRACLALLALVFLAWHVPLLYRTSAGQDESWYGVTGMSILRTGLPHIPYVASDDPSSVCYRADVAVYTLPPLFFYLQALVHVVLGDGLGQARLASTLAGLGAVFLVYDLGRIWFDDRRGALLGAVVYLFSRPFLFPATTARPDMTAAAFGLLAVWWAVRYGRDPRRRLLAASGAAAGLSMLAHPFGVVPTVQVGLWTLARSGPTPTRRLLDALVFSAAALSAFSLWAPLIALHPDIFRAQFGQNVLDRGGPGPTLSALVLAFVFQLHQLRELLGPIQSALFLAGLAWSLLGAMNTPGTREFRYHLWASLLLLLLFLGRHPTLAYFAYPAGFASLSVGMLASAATARLGRRIPSHRTWTHRAATGVALTLLLTALLPGAGPRTLLAHLRHWNDPSYDAHALVRSILADIPPDATVAVDTAYVIDFHLARRPVVEALIEPDEHMHFYDVRDRRFDYAVLGPVGLQRVRPRMDDLVLIKTYGNRRDPMAAYAELYRRVRHSAGTPDASAGSGG